MGDNPQSPDEVWRAAALRKWESLTEAEQLAALGRAMRGPTGVSELKARSVGLEPCSPAGIVSDRLEELGRLGEAAAVSS